MVGIVIDAAVDRNQLIGEFAIQQAKVSGIEPSAFQVSVDHALAGIRAVEEAGGVLKNKQIIEILRRVSDVANDDAPTEAIKDKEKFRHILP